METEAAATPTRNDGVIDLPAPPGWLKKFIPKKGTPRRSTIIFISPTGEEIRSPRQLKQYLRTHPGNPSASEFVWGTGDSPRRSARLSEKSKAEEIPESQSPKRRQRKSSSKKGKGKKDDSEEERETTNEKAGDTPKSESPKKKQRKSSSKKGAKARGDPQTEDESTEVAAERNKGSVEIAMEDAEDAKDLVGAPDNEDDVEDTLTKTLQEVVTKEVPDKDEEGNVEIIDETKIEKAVGEEVPADKEDVEVLIDNVDETKVEKSENQETSAAKEQGTVNTSLPTPGIDKGKEIEGKSLLVQAVLENSKGAEEEAVLTEPATDEQDSENKDAAPKVVADSEVEKQVGDANVGLEDHQKEEIPSGGEKANEAESDIHGLKDDQEPGNPPENQSVSREDISHEPQTSQVSS